ncbi:MAG: glycosyltransferase [Cohaesibacter sp.]|nr:glycosyltransferase [Cohaesibacter sp.]
MTIQTDKVLYLVSSYNKSPYIRSVLDSIVIDSDAFHASLVIIDDGSTDQSVDIIQTFVSQYEHKLPITFIARDNRGIFQTTNQLGDIARKLDPEATSFIRLIDSDDPIMPGSTALLIKASKDLQCHLVKGEAIAYGPDALKAEQMKAEPNTLAEAHIMSDSLLYCLTGFDFVPTQSLYHSSAFFAALPISDNFVSCQDYAIALQIALKGDFASLNYPVCYQMVRGHARLSDREALTFHQTAGLIRHYCKDQLPLSLKRRAEQKQLSRAKRYLQNHQKRKDMKYFFRGLKLSILKNIIKFLPISLWSYSFAFVLNIYEEQADIGYISNREKTPY